MKICQKPKFKLNFVFSNMGSATAAAEISHSKVHSKTIQCAKWRRLYIYTSTYTCSRCVWLRREEITVPTRCYSTLKWAHAAQCSNYLYLKKKLNEQSTGWTAKFYYSIYKTLPAGFQCDIMSVVYVCVCVYIIRSDGEDGHAGTFFWMPSASGSFPVRRMLHTSRSRSAANF